MIRIDGYGIANKGNHTFYFLLFYAAFFFCTMLYTFPLWVRRAS